MDPAIIVFGLGIGVLVGMTGMGGGSLMTPLLILIFGIQPTTAIGTDIFYSAVTKTVGGWRHFRMKTVNMELVKWLSFGSVPAAVLGVAIVSVLQDHIGEDRLDSLVYAVLGGTLLMVGVITLTRALILRDLVVERDRFEVERRHKVAADRDRRHHRLRDRHHLSGVGHGDRDPADRRLPPGAEEGGRHRRLPRRDPALGRGYRPHRSAATSTSPSPPTS